MSFIPLFCQSHHSPRGVASPADLVRRARGLGYNTLGLCDEGTLAGFHDFDLACDAQGIRPVFGCRITVKGLVLTGLAFPVDLLIETEQGYRNLVRLLNLQHARRRAGHDLLAGEALGKHVQGLVTVIPVEGELTELLRRRQWSDVERFARIVAGLIGPGLAFGAAPDGEENQAFARRIRELARFLGRFVQTHALAAPVVHYPEPGDAAAFVYLEHRQQPPGRSWKPPTSLADLPMLRPEQDELERWPEELADLVGETAAIARRCYWRLGPIRRAFPSLDLERGFELNSYLFDQVIKGATELYGEITEPLKQRINRELEEVKEHGLAPYLLLCHLIATALDERGISRGVGRGRMVSSVLAYCLGISRIDPLQYNLNPKTLMQEGWRYPPVDIEIPHAAVPELLAWLSETFGEDHVSEIGRIQEWRRDHMINELARWAGMTDEERRLARREKARLRSTGAAQRLGELTEAARSRRWRDPAFSGDLAARLAPRPRRWVSDGNRFALSGQSLEWVIPRVTSDQLRTVTGLPEAAIDYLGVARLVFHPHNMLDILDQCFRASRTLDPTLDFSRLPLDDRATMELIARGETGGIPPLEGVTLRCMLMTHRPTNMLQLLRIKSESMPERRVGATLEVGGELPDVLLSYQCAWFKVHCPQAFFAAVIGAAIHQGASPSGIVSEARRAGFDVLAPDINLSDWGTTIHHGGIRLGLSTVHNFGRKAWENLQAVRSGGPFVSLEEFCRRVDTHIINARVLRSLIAAGAFDTFGPPRAAMDEMVAQLQRQARERNARGQQRTFFGMEDVVGEPDEPDTDAGQAPLEPPDVEEWNHWRKAQRESEALGFFLSIDPIQRFHIALSHLRPLRVAQCLPRYLGREVWVAGLVERWEDNSPLVEGEGAVLLDLEGMPVALEPALAAVSAPCLVPAAEVLVTGRLEKQHRYLWLRAEGLWRLRDIEEQAGSVGRLQLDLSGENKATLKLLIAALQPFAGETELELINYPDKQGWTWKKLTRMRVFFCSPLFQRLCRILPPDCVTMFSHAGRRLLIEAAELPEAEGAEADEVEVEPTPADPHEAGHDATGPHEENDT